MKTSSRIVVIGGGVIGLACAHYLNEDGYRVTVVERDQVGRGASHGNCGLLYFSDVTPLCAPGAVRQEMFRTLCGTSPLYIKPDLDLPRYLWLARFAAHCVPSHKRKAAGEKAAILKYSSHLFRELFNHHDLSCDRESRGVLAVFRDPEKWKAYAQTSRFVEDYCPGYSALGAAEALALEPALRTDIAGAWHLPDDSHLRPDRLMASWKSLLLTRGISFKEQCEVTGIHTSKNRITGVQTRDGLLTADGVILATGAWAPQLGKSLGLNIPVQPGKGYSITMARPSTCPSLPCMLYERNMVVTPWTSGYRLGGTMEFSGYDLALTRRRLDKLVSGAREYLKDPIGTPVVEEWTSLRPMTYDDMPIIGRAPGLDNAVVATGHGMLGLTLATGTGRMAADLLAGRRPEIDPEPYSLGRF